MKNWLKKFGPSETGNVLTFLLGGVTLVGILSYGGYQLLSGPFSSASNISQINVAKNQLFTISQIAILDAVNQMDGGDCDSDGFIEPRAFRTPSGAAPVNGGSIPLEMGAPTLDPWGVEFGYCAWDAGAASAQPSCGGATGRLDGSNTPLSSSADTSLAFAIISAGADKTFQTTCSAYVDDSTPLITTGGDDIIQKFSYQQSNTSASALWSLKANAFNTAETAKQLEVGSNIAMDTGAGSIQASSLQTTGKIIAGGGLMLGTESDVTVCGATDAGTLRYNTSTTEVQFCNGSGSWLSAGFTVSWPIQGPDGSSGAPSYSFENATTAGLYYDGTDTVKLIAPSGEASSIKGEASVISAGDSAFDITGQGTVSMTVPNDDKITFGRNGDDDFRLSSDGGVQIADTTVTCGLNTSGTIRYLTASKTFEFCNGASWTAWPPEGGVAPTITENIVFVTSETFTGNLGGVSGADDKCQAAAVSANLPGTYKAWIADSSNSPSSTFAKSTVAYKLVDGTTIADNWSDLIDAALDNSIDLDEFGNAAASKTWTGVSDVGGIAGARCNDWVDETSGTYGRFGTTSQTSGNWTDNGFSDTCDNSYPLYCFGQNFDISSIVLSEPMITIGFYGGCGIKTDGDARCWGYGIRGKIGDGDMDDHDTPVALAEAGPWKMISSNYETTCAIKNEDNSLWCWGEGQYDQIGDGTNADDNPTPIAIAVGEEWKFISAGGYGTCGIKIDNTAWCWGYGTYGMVGDGTGVSAGVPTAVAGGHTWKSLDVGESHVCGIISDDTAYCWGYGQYGKLGNSSSTTRDAPELVTQYGTGTWIDIDAGDDNTCGIQPDGAAVCWGYEQHGELGTGGAGSGVVSGGHTWKSISSGQTVTCGIRTDDTLYCWGERIANGTGSDINTPNPIAGGYQWKSVTAGDFSACGITSSDVMMCWGSDTFGSLGGGSAGTSSTPAPVVDW